MLTKRTTSETNANQFMIVFLFINISFTMGKTVIYNVENVKGDVIFDSSSFPNIENDSIDKTCRSASNEIHTSNPDLQKDFRWMSSSFPEIRTVQSDPVEIHTVHLYERKRGATYRSMLDICENQFHYDMCYVTAQVDFSTDINDTPVKKRITEYKKPLCMPRSCADNQALLVDPNPAGCFPEKQNCKVNYYEISCLKDRNVTHENGGSSLTSSSSLIPSTHCEQDKIPAASPYFAHSTFMEGAMKSECASVATGGRSRVCIINYGSFTITTLKEFTERYSVTAYNTFEQNCLESSGKICNALMEVQHEVPNGDAGTVFLKKIYNDYPFCMPLECSFPSDLNILLLEQFIPVSGDVLVGKCDIDSGACKVHIWKVNCPGYEIFTKSHDTPTENISSLPNFVPTLISSAFLYSLKCTKGFAFISFVLGLLFL